MPRDGPPNGVPTPRRYPWRPCDHPTPGTRHTGKPLENSKEHTYQGKRGAGEAAATELQLSVRTAKQCKHVGDKRALRACGAPHMIDRWLARLEVNFA